MNGAIVSNIDANPPLFYNVYWLLGHGISMNPYFLRGVSIVLFALAIALFFRHTTRLVGSPPANAIIFLIVSSLIYLNYTLSTQVRTYSLYLLLAGIYFIVLHKLIRKPDRAFLLVAHLVMGLLMVMVHNFGLFYMAVSFSFVGLLWLWSRQKSYLSVLLSYILIFGLWFLVWYPSFVIQSRVGQPFSWIPDPTFMSFFKTQGELLPTLSARMERLPVLNLLPMLRIGIVLTLFLSIAIPGLRRGFKAMIDDEAFSFYVMAGYLTGAVALLALLVSVGYKSVFLSRYQWPSTLLILFQLAYAYHQLAPTALRVFKPRVWMPLLAMGVLAFMFYQNQKLVQFPKEVINYLPANPGNDPVFLESADYFLPIQHYHLANAHFLLDRDTAISPRTIRNSTNDFNVISSLREKYNMKGAVPVSQFDKAHFAHFYVIDEASRYQIEAFIARGQVKVVKSIPIPINGHRLLECSF